MTYQKALEYIGKVCWQDSRPGLARISELCERMGNIQNELKFVHIAGTNGKGSTTSMLASILMSQGKKVGIFTSPFIYRFNERIAINGEPISDEDLAKTLKEIIVYAEAMQDKPTEFELITALGFLYFYKQKCDIVLLECGMGGRLDSTNVIENPLLCVITTIGLDHTAFLGPDTESIAAEKAGIIKKNCKVIVGEADEKAAEKIKEKAEKENAEIKFCDLNRAKNISLSLNGTSFSLDGFEEKINLPLLGSYQVKNAQLAIECALALGVKKESISEGLSRVKWKGRFEILSKNPLVIYDGSHNPQGICECVKSVEKILGKKVCVLCAVMADKDYQTESREIAKIAEKVFCVRANNKRSLDEKSLACVFCKQGVCAEAFDSMEAALCSALKYCKEKDIPLIAMGSLYMYHDFVDALNNKKGTV